MNSIQPSQSRESHFSTAYSAVNLRRKIKPSDTNFSTAYSAVNGNLVADRRGGDFSTAYSAVNMRCSG